MRIKPPLYRTRVEVFLIDRKAIYIYLKEKIEQFEGEDVSYFYKDSYSIFFFFHSPFDACHSRMPVFSREKQSTTPSRLRRKYFVKCKETEELLCIKDFVSFDFEQSPDFLNFPLI